MAGYLIKETTCEERKQIVEEALGNLSASCDGCMAGLADMYQDYIDGKKEIRDINMEFNARYERGDMDREERRSEGLEEEIGKKIRFDKGRCFPDDPDVYAADPGRKRISTAVFCCGYDHRGPYPWF